MFEKEAKERARDYTENKERQIAYECGFLDGADRMREEMQKQGLALQSDMDKTIEQNCVLKKRIEKMKNLEEDNADLKQSLDWANERESEDVKRITELEEQISVLLSCKNCPENKGGYICEKEYENKCLAQKIQYIKELQEENAKQKKEIKISQRCWQDQKNISLDTNCKLHKAKNLLRELYSIVKVECSPFAREGHKNILSEVEQFIIGE